MLSTNAKLGPIPEQHLRKLPGHPSNIVNSLERKYRETLGEIKKLEAAEYDWVGREGYELAEQYWRDRLESLKATLFVLERSIRMFDPRWIRKSLMTPKITRTGRALLPKTAFQSTLVQVLRAASEPLLVRDIAARIASGLGLSMVRPDQRDRIKNMAHGVLQRNLKKGHVTCAGSPAKWSTVRSVSQAARGRRSR